MVSHLFFYQLVLVALVWLCVMLQWAWPSDPAPVCPTTPEPPGPRPKRHHEPTPFAGLTKKPHCDACEHASGLCRKFCSGDYEGAVAPGYVGIRRRGSRTVRPQ